MEKNHSVSFPARMADANPACHESNPDFIPNREKSVLDITKQNIRCCDIGTFEDGVFVEYELWFDVDQYFGTNTAAHNDVWINFYTIYFPYTDTVKALVFMEGDEFTQEFYWELTEEEENFFYEKMEECCMGETKTSCMLSLWEEKEGKLMD